MHLVGMHTDKHACDCGYQDSAVILFLCISGSASKSASKQANKGAKSERRKSGNWGKQNHNNDMKVIHCCVDLGGKIITKQ